MSAGVEYLLDKASAAEIAEHLARCDADFVPPLSGRVKINDYAQKIANNATQFEAWSGGTLIGLVAAYCNDIESGVAFVTNVSVLREWAGKGIISKLISQCIEHAKKFGMWQISLEVEDGNMPAIKLYEKYGFVAGKVNLPFIKMHLNLENKGTHEQPT